MHAVLTEADFSVRLALFFVGHVVVFVWTRYIVAPASAGWPRALRLIPLIPVLYVLPPLFSREDPTETTCAAYAFLQFFWLTPVQLLAFCMNRGQLMKSYDCGDTSAFAAGLLLCIRLTFEEKQLSKDVVAMDKGEHAFKDVRFSVVRLSGGPRWKEALRLLLIILVSTEVSGVMVKAAQMSESAGSPFWRDFCLGWTLYAMTVCMQDAPRLLCLVTLNISVAPGFRSPFLSRSMQELWSKRYNMVVGGGLRELLYEPVRDGRLKSGPQYFETNRRPRWRILLAYVVTFSVSGLLHSWFHWWFSAGRSFPMLLCFFFVACGAVVMGEWLVKEVARMSGYYAVLSKSVPDWLLILYTWVALFTLAHFLLWPELHDNGYVAKLLAAAPQSHLL